MEYSYQKKKNLQKNIRANIIKWKTQFNALTSMN